MKKLLLTLLFVCSVAGALVALLDASAAAQTVGPNINLSKAAGNQYETSVAINPKNNNQIFVVGRNEIGGLSSARSSDGGVTWTSKIIGTVNPAAPGNVPRAYGNASVAWDDFGNLFLAYLSQNSSTSQVLYVTIALSTDGGANFYSPTGVGSAIIVPPNGLSYYTGDQPTVTVGPGSGGFAGSVWVTYFSIGIWVSGAGVSGLGSVGTFTSQPLPSQPSGVNFGDIAVGPNGEVIVTYGPDSGASGTIYTNIDPDGLGPAPFSTYTPAASVNLGGFSYIPAQPNWGIDPEAGLAYDRSGGPHSGRVYLVYTDAPSVGSTDTNIFVVYSDDQGATWSTPVRVNDDTGTNSQFLPHISLDQSNGMIAVTWYDARNAAANDTAQYFGAFSSDGGATFGPNFQISAGTSNQANSVAALKKADYGDYTGNAFVNGRLVPAWADNSNSTGDNPNGATEFEIYAAVVQAPVVAQPVACSATNATITFVNKWWLDVVLKTGDPVTHVVYTPTPAGTTFVGVTGFAVGELVDYVGTLDAVPMCHATSMTVKPAPAPIVISPATLPNVTAGVPYSAAITVTGGLSPVAITSVTGLPAGFAWNGSLVTGTATTLGTNFLTVTASDARGLVQTSYPTLQVVDAPITLTANLSAGKVGVQYSATLSASGGYGSITFSATGLPAGLTLTGSIISGTPTTAGTYSLVLTATDSLGSSVSATPTLVINPAVNYTIPDEGKGKISAVGAGYLMVGTKKLIWNANTTIIVNTPNGVIHVINSFVKKGMKVQWKGLRDKATNTVLTSQLEIN